MELDWAAMLPWQIIWLLEPSPRFFFKVTPTAEQLSVKEKLRDGPLVIQTFQNQAGKVAGYGIVMKNRKRMGVQLPVHNTFGFSVAASYCPPEHAGPDAGMTAVFRNQHLVVMRVGDVEWPVYNIVMRYKEKA